MRAILRSIPLLIALGLPLASDVLALGAQEGKQGKQRDMRSIVIEPLGGFAGGTPLGPTRTQGRMAWSDLSEADQARLDALFAERKPVNANFRYRLTRDGPNGAETVEAPPESVP